MVGPPSAVQVDLVRKAVEAGMTCFDTAHHYGDGTSERNLGYALREADVTVDIVTKVLLRIEDMASVRDKVRRQVEESLERLGVGRLSVLFLHNRITAQHGYLPTAGIGAAITVEDFLRDGGVAETFRELKAEGTILATGVTTWGADPAATRIIVDTQSVDVINCEYSLLERGCGTSPTRDSDGIANPTLIQQAANKGIGVMVIRALGGGQLGAITDLLAAHADSALNKEIVRSGGPVGFALRYAFSRPEVSSVVVGISEPNHLNTALHAAEMGVLPEHTLNQMQRAFHSGAGR